MKKIYKGSVTERQHSVFALFIFILLFQCLLFNLTPVSAQTGEWTWVHGDSSYNMQAVYGVQGVASPLNKPPAVYQCNFWTDHNGNFWLFGGLDSAFLQCNDLWKYDVANNEWTWMKGPGIANDTGNWGMQGVTSPLTYPPGRSYGSASWVDTSGNLWMFGGSTTNVGHGNDLWKYVISTNEWTWMKGSRTGYLAPVYGTQGVPSVNNDPGSRIELNAYWRDNDNNLWLYGSQGPADFKSDLWRYTIATNEWTWMHGGQAGNLPAIYGTKNVPNAANTPGARFASSPWKDCSGNFWLFGGVSTGGGIYGWNDLWQYDVSVNQWIWKYGPNGANQPGNSSPGKCVYSAVSLPSDIYEAKSTWQVDNLFFMYAGYDFYTGGTRNNLWCYDVTAGRWIYVNGTSQLTAPAKYGTLNVSSAVNQPGSRMGSAAWYGGDGWLYLFGGGFNGPFTKLNDLWKFKIDTACTHRLDPPVAAFAVSDTVLCENDCVSYSDHSQNASSWQWTFQGGIPATSSDQSPALVCYTTAGIYNVSLIINNGCENEMLVKNNLINVVPAPPTPLIVQYGDTLVCSSDPSYTSYQWYADTALIPGATDTSIMVTHSGNYNVQVTNAAGCKTAVGINVVIGLQTFTADGLPFTVYPNPAGDKLYINGYTGPGELILTICNTLGQYLHSRSFKETGEAIEISRLSSGIYFVQAVSGNDRWMGRFVKE